MDILSLKNGSLIPNFNDNEIEFCIVDSIENCLKIEDDPTVEFYFVKKRMAFHGEFDVIFLVIKLNEITYKTYFMTKLEDQKIELKKFLETEKFNIKILKRNTNEVTVSNVFVNKTKFYMNEEDFTCFSENMKKEDLKLMNELIENPLEHKYLISLLKLSDKIKVFSTKEDFLDAQERNNKVIEEVKKKKKFYFF